jgi:hypothetical protein
MRCRLRSVSLAIVLGTAVSVQAQTSDQEKDPALRTRAEILDRQREAKADELAPYVVSKAEERVHFIETWRLPFRLLQKGVGGFRPVLGGLPSGSGFVGGGGYITGYNSDLLQFTANARFSTRDFQAYDAGLLIFPRTNSLLPVEGYARAGLRDFASVRFFGLGEGAPPDRTTYRLEDRTFELGLNAWAGRFAELGGGVQWLTSETGSGGEGFSLEERFDPISIPGFGVETDFFRYGGGGAIHLREESVDPSVGMTFRFDVHRYDDRNSAAFDFTRAVGEVQAHIPIVHRNRIVALRVRTSHSLGEHGGTVPFHLMETLGGAASIRGFREYRFRDTRNIVVNAEYRWEVWTYADFAVFYDGGKVFSDASDLDFSNLESGYGFGIRGHGPGGAVMRFDFAWSREGFIWHIGSGPSF